MLRQGVGGLVAAVVDAAGDDRVVGVAVDVLDDDLHADARDHHAAPAIAGPGLAHAAAHRLGVVEVPVEADQHAAVVVAVDVRPAARAVGDHRGRLGPAHRRARRAPLGRAGLARGDQGVEALVRLPARAPGAVVGRREDVARRDAGERLADQGGVGRLRDLEGHPGRERGGPPARDGPRAAGALGVERLLGHPPALGVVAVAARIGRHLGAEAGHAGCRAVELQRLGRLLEVVVDQPDRSADVAPGRRPGGEALRHRAVVGLGLEHLVAAAPGRHLELVEDHHLVARVGVLEAERQAEPLHHAAREGHVALAVLDHVLQDRQRAPDVEPVARPQGARVVGEHVPEDVLHRLAVEDALARAPVREREPGHGGHRVGVPPGAGALVAHLGDDAVEAARLVVAPPVRGQIELERHALADHLVVDVRLLAEVLLERHRRDLEGEQLVDALRGAGRDVLEVELRRRQVDAHRARAVREGECGHRGLPVSNSCVNMRRP